ncbi:MAG: tetratricopeptide repeat protein [Phycisphaerae bacterium]
MLHLLRRRPQYVLATGLFAAIIGTYTLAAIRYPMLYIWGTYEDLFGEWMQFWCLVVALVFAARMARVRWRFRWFFLLTAVSCFYVAMEEISWGQRLFQFSSPYYFRANNLQGELNLHNFLTGPYTTQLKAAVTYVLAFSLVAYGLVYPAALRLRLRWAAWLDARGIAAPPLYLSPFFLGGAILEWGPFHFNEAEVAEILVALGLALTAAQYQFSARRGLDVHDYTSWPVGACGRLTGRLCRMTALIILLTAGTTVAVYASPSHRARIDARVQNGVKKFADRYARYEQWDIVADLYRRVHVDNPRSTSTLRKLADSCKKMGDVKQFNTYLEKALKIGLERYREHPDRPSVNRSLARTYWMLGDDSKAREHLRCALRSDLERVNEDASSAAAAYSLGKTYSLMRQYRPAFEQLARAYALKPTSKRYRKAYFSAKKMVR